MKQVTLEKKIAMLPTSLRLKAEGYVDALLNQNNINVTVVDKVLQTYLPVDSNTGVFSVKEPDHAFKQKNKMKREFGGLKGFVTYMADDFDAPMDDFKAYM
ncbi:DUF2281 domain-containing protein [Mucilaginibacter terrae]|uniref:DUF2281 domain-containing protein n=1 Tax=Mucilaginibacter terrae TaxID=1955052 RepID=UPI0036349CA0